uniref:Putative secreted protein n=1 Tax=Ixodes ricinus TaxID=34613 RepID=A0A0K8R778_IXORI
MRALRQALPWTWVLFLFLRAANGATVTGAGPATPDIEKWLAIISGDKFYGQDTSSDTTPSLLGMHAYCVTMKFLQTGGAALPNTLSLSYIDSSDKSRSTYRTYATLSIKVKSKSTVTFTFTSANKTELMGREVRYNLLFDGNQDNSYCSILVTSMGQPNCSYWFLFMGQGGTIPDWCQLPLPKEEKCKVENYTLTKPRDCGVESAEEEGKDEDDSEESDSEESEEDESEDEEDEGEEDELEDKYEDNEEEDDEEEENESR